MKHEQASSLLCAHTAVCVGSWYSHLLLSATLCPGLTVVACHPPLTLPPLYQAVVCRHCWLQVRVIRAGAELTVSCFDLLVGDVLLLEAGDILPADGLLIQGDHIK